MARRVRTPLKQLLGDLRRGPLTFLVWAIAVAGAVHLLGRRARPEAFAGIARALEYEVAAARPGVLDTLHVDLYEDVDAGALVATLDPREVEAAITTAAAEADRLRAEIAAERAALEREEWLATRDDEAERRRFAIDAEERALELVELRVRIEADRIEHERLEVLRARAQELAARSVGPEADVEDLRLQVVRLRGIVENNQVLEARLEQELASARDRLERYRQHDGAPRAGRPRLAALREAVRVQEARAEEIAVARRALVLRAPVGGRVTQVVARPGQVVLPGEPVALLTGARAAEIVAYLPERAGLEVAPGARVQVARRSDPGVRADGIVHRVGPAIEELPARLWRDPAVAEFGRPLLIAGAARLDVAPGEHVTVRILQ